MAKIWNKLETKGVRQGRFDLKSPLNQKVVWETCGLNLEKLLPGQREQFANMIRSDGNVANILLKTRETIEIPETLVQEEYYTRPTFPHR